jgi:SAM-dependent methyltransferase
MDAEVSAVQRASEYYRRAVEGHVYIDATFAALFETIGRHVTRLGERPSLLELGSHAGFVTEGLLGRWPDLDIVVSDEDRELVTIAKQRLSGRNVRFHERPLEAVDERFDLVVSVAKHHHLVHGYLGAVHSLLQPEGVYVLADELCPEYCAGEDLERISRARALRIAGGYVFTSDADFEAYRARGVVPRYAADLEDKRRRALWRWYRFVVDEAVDRGYFDIAAGELQSARDDLVTGSEAEHKFSPAIIEREFALAGFRLLERTLVGPLERPERQSMFVYVFAPASR